MKRTIARHGSEVVLICPSVQIKELKHTTETETETGTEAVELNQKGINPQQGGWAVCADPGGPGVNGSTIDTWC